MDLSLAECRQAAQSPIFLLISQFLPAWRQRRGFLVWPQVRPLPHCIEEPFPTTTNLQWLPSAVPDPTAARWQTQHSHILEIRQTIPSDWVTLEFTQTLGFGIFQGPLSLLKKKKDPDIWAYVTNFQKPTKKHEFFCCSFSPVPWLPHYSLGWVRQSGRKEMTTTTHPKYH